MKQYPRIPHYDKGLFGSYIYAFDKKDGSNIRAEFNYKRGWYKFGTRNTMIDELNPQFGEAVKIFLKKYSESLPKIFKEKYPNTESFVVFFEYLGENSFAGLHIETDIKDVILFDISLYKKGFISPKDFINNFGNLDIPRIVYQGEYNMELIQNIRDNIFNLKEGVICKGVHRDEVWMTKIKCDSWLLKLKDKYGLNSVKEDIGDLPITSFNF